MSLGQMKDRERGKFVREAHAIYKRSAKTKEERNREGRQSERASESGSSRETRLRLFRRVRRERKTSDVSVHARSEVRGREGVVVVGQGVGNDHTTPERSRRKSGEGKDTTMRDVGRRRGRVGPTKRRTKRRTRRRKGYRAAGMEGRRKRGGSDGVNCRRQGHRLYLAGTADTCLRRYTRTVL